MNVTFRMSLTEGIPKFFIMHIAGGPQQYVVELVFEPLIELDRNSLQLIPTLAESWEVSPDGLTYTFHLVHNAKWHDGVPFTSADVKYTFEYEIQNKLSAYGLLKGIDTIETPDDYTVVTTLKSPDSSFLVKVSGRWQCNTDIMPKHLLDGTDWTKDTEFLQHPIGTGPYKFDSYDGNQVVLLRNDQWYGGTPGFARIIATVIPSNTIAAKAFENNELDWMYMFQVPSMSEYIRLKSLPGNDGGLISAWMDAIEFNTGRPPFSDVMVRKAFTYAIDRDELNQKIFLGQGKAQVSPSFPDWLSWAVNPDVKLPEYNPDMANQILDQAGYTKGNDGFRFTVKISYAAPFYPPPEFVDVLKSQLAKVGINVVHEPNEWDVWHQKVYQNLDFDIALHHMSVVGDPEIGVSDELEPGKLYFFGYNNSQIIEMLHEAASKTAHADRAPIYFDIQKKLSDDLPYIALVDAPQPILWKTTIAGISQGDNGRLRFAHPAATPENATSASTTSTTMTGNYTPYLAIVIVILIVAGVYSYRKRKKTT